MKQHEIIKLNKIVAGVDIEKRHEVFSERMIDPTLSQDEKLPIHLFYPSNEMSNCLKEIVASFPVDLILTGDIEGDNNTDTLRKMLYSYSYLQKALQDIYTESLYSDNVYLVPTPKLDNDGSFLFSFEFEVLESEKVWVEYDILTKHPKIVIHEDVVSHFDAESSKNIDVKIRKTYSIDGIQISATDMGGKAVSNYNNVFVPNPFKGVNLLPVIEFKGLGAGGIPLATKLVNPQLEMDYINTGIQNTVHLNSNPLWVIEKSMRDMSGFTFGAGQVVTLMGEEKLSAVTAKVQLDEMRVLMEFFVERIYKTAGLLPPKLKEKIFTTDSSKVVKLAQNELIGIIKSTLNFVQKGLDKLLIMACYINELEYKNEKFEVPQEVLPFDLGNVVTIYATAMNLGLYDDEHFWNTYDPYLSNDERERIKEFFIKRNSMGALDQKNTNVSNEAKSQQTLTMGNKEGNKSENSEARKDNGKSTQD